MKVGMLSFHIKGVLRAKVLFQCQGGDIEKFTAHDVGNTGEVSGLRLHWRYFQLFFLPKTVDHIQCGKKSQMCTAHTNSFSHCNFASHVSKENRAQYHQDIQFFLAFLSEYWRVLCWCRWLQQVTWQITQATTPAIPLPTLPMKSH